MNCCDDFGQCKQGHGCPARSTALQDHEKKAAYDYGVACRTAKLGEGWVRVTDKLPKECVSVQVFGKVPYGRNMRVLVAYRTYDWEQTDFGAPLWTLLSSRLNLRVILGVREVIAWKPLSSPPIEYSKGKPLEKNQK